jgi:hypothetical protein
MKRLRFNSEKQARTKLSHLIHEGQPIAGVIWLGEIIDRMEGDEPIMLEGFHVDIVGHDVEGLEVFEVFPKKPKHVLA